MPVSVENPVVVAEQADDPGDAAGVETVLRDLIAVLEADSDVPGRDEGGMLADVVVDGVRCTFQRVHVSAVDVLSPREREIARMVSQGYTNKMIANVLDISLWTVSTHLRRIFAKLGVQTRAAMVAMVMSGFSPGDRPPSNRP